VDDDPGRRSRPEHDADHDRRPLLLAAGTVEPGSAYNTLTQRVSSALGLAVLTAVATVQQAQFMADRSTLVTSAGPSVDPRIVALEHSGGEAALIPYWEQLRNEVEAQAYSNIFLIVGVLTLAGLDWRPSSAMESRPAVAVNRQRWVEMSTIRWS